MNDHRIPLEACPSSNVQTGAVRDLASHPLKLYYDLGLRVTVNTDNRLVTDTTVSNELWICHAKMGLGLQDIKTIIVSGFKSAFMPFHIKQSYLRRVTDELDRFQPDGRILPPQQPEPARSSSEHWLPSRGVAPTSFSAAPSEDISPVHAAVERVLEDGAN